LSTSTLCIMWKGRRRTPCSFTSLHKALSAAAFAAAVSLSCNL
jgi:hypothetical protein